MIRFAWSKKRHHLATFDITSQANYDIDFCFILYSKPLDKPDLGVSLRSGRENIEW